MNSVMHQGGRKWKDAMFTPFAKFARWLKLTPIGVTTIGFILGLVSIGLLFTNYWYFAIAIAISTFLDGVDGRLARLTNQVTPLGVKYDYGVDFTLMLLVYISLTVWLQEPMWILGLNVFGLLLLLNYILDSPLKMFPGRMWVVTPAMLGFPRIGLMAVLLYTALMYMLLIKKMIKRKN